MRLRARVTAIILAFCIPALAGAATFRVDDSLTLPNETHAEMKWRSLSPARGAGNAIEGASVLTIRLNVAPWKGRDGRIYMALPEQPIGTVIADWTTQGRLLPGQLVSGNRTLVYAGRIPPAMIEDTIVLRLQADGQRLSAPQRLQFYFEIDVE